MAYEPTETRSKPRTRTKKRTKAGRKFNLKNASTGDPDQREATPAATVTEAIDRRTVRQAILTQLLTEVADEIINSGATLTTHNVDGSIKRKGTLGTRYRTEKASFPLLRELIADPEAAFNARRNKLFVVNEASVQRFGSINLVVFRNAMALGDDNSPVNPEEVAKRVIIRAGRSSGYGARSKEDRGFTGCK
jgi:hypothetical protein